MRLQAARPGLPPVLKTCGTWSWRQQGPLTLPWNVFLRGFLSRSGHLCPPIAHTRTLSGGNPLAPSFIPFSKPITKSHYLTCHFCLNTFIYPQHWCTRHQTCPGPLPQVGIEPPSGPPVLSEALPLSHFRAMYIFPFREIRRSFNPEASLPRAAQCNPNMVVEYRISDCPQIRNINTIFFWNT